MQYMIWNPFVMHEQLISHVTWVSWKQQYGQYIKERPIDKVVRIKETIGSSKLNLMREAKLTKSKGIR